MPNKSITGLFTLIVASSIIVVPTAGCISDLEDDGDTIDETVDESEIGDSARQALGIDELIRSSHHILFHYKLIIRHHFRGRSMKSPNGRFCQHYQSIRPTDPNSPPFNVDIQLVRNKQWPISDEFLETVTFPNDGRVHSHCWPFHDSDGDYHFDYTPQADGYRLRARGVVYR